jgi:hypothetical protein
MYNETTGLVNITVRLKRSVLGVIIHGVGASRDELPTSAALLPD